MSYQKTLYGKTAYGLLRTAKIVKMSAGNNEIVVRLKTPYGDEWQVRDCEYGISLHNSMICLNMAIVEHTQTSATLVEKLTDKLYN